MSRYVYLMFCIFWAQAAYPFIWQDLWKTPNQQAQILMDKGRFKAAEKRFNRPDWQAAAAYRSGHYEQAATQFESLNSEQGYYNQGNALAHLGRYEEALDAYDKALRINPDNRDALFNRKLVDSLMKKDKERQQHSQRNKKQKNPQKNQQQSKQQQQNNDQSSTAGNDSRKSDQQQEKNQAKTPKNQQPNVQNQKNQEAENKTKQNPSNHSQKTRQQQKQQANDQKKKQNRTAKPKKPVQSTAEKEKKQAKEQWLRLIPDDPGGLLRNKFLRDHIRRQRGWYQ